MSLDGVYTKCVFYPCLKLSGTVSGPTGIAILVVNTFHFLISFKCTTQKLCLFIASEFYILLLAVYIRCKNAQHGEKVRLGSVLEDNMFIIYRKHKEQRNICHRHT